MILRMVTTAMAALALTSAVFAGPEWVEGTGGTGDAGSFNNDAQRPQGFGQLTTFGGQLEGVGAPAGVNSFGGPAGEFNDFEDVYLIEIVDPANFSATVDPNGTDFDTILWLFRVDGTGVLANDDAPLFAIPLNNNGLNGKTSPFSAMGNSSDDGTGIELGPGDEGLYVIAVTEAPNICANEGGPLFDFQLLTEVSGPDGDGGSDPFDFWTTGFAAIDAGPTPGSYLIFVTGVQFAQVGACCFSDGTCDDTMEEDECIAAFGFYEGNFTDCISAPCALGPAGACCFADGSCMELAEQICDLSLGVYQGDGVDCLTADCQPFGACCFPGGGCIETTEVDCINGGAFYQGDFTGCGGVTCPVMGACCFGDGTCDDLDAIDCGLSGGTYQGDLTTCAATTCVAGADRASSSEKGSLLYFSKVELRWSGDTGNFLKQDTFIDIANDFPGQVRVQMYFINGDAPLAADGPERAHPGWNWLDNVITLTGNEPAYWSASTGQPKGVSPFTVLDSGTPPGRPANDGTGDRVLRGYVVAWAVDNFGREIRLNHLKGDATLVNYSTGFAWEYNAMAVPVVADVGNNVQPDGTPGRILMNGNEYARIFDVLEFNFYAVDSLDFPDTDITIHPASVDLRQDNDGPVTTKANFEIWNMNEVKFSGTHRCVTCWDQTLLRDYQVPNHFHVFTLGTNMGRARIDGLQSTVCDVDFLLTDGALGNHPNDVVSMPAALIGVRAQFSQFDSLQLGASGNNMHGAGTQDAMIQYDAGSGGGPPESNWKGGK